MLTNLSKNKQSNGVAHHGRDPGKGTEDDQRPSTNEGPTKVAKTKDLAKGPSPLLMVQRSPSLKSALRLGDPSCNFCGQLSTLECHGMPPSTGFSCPPRPTFDCYCPADKTRRGEKTFVIWFLIGSSKNSVGRK